jgi:hypothetical protein
MEKNLFLLIINQGIHMGKLRASLILATALLGSAVFAAGDKGVASYMDKEAYGAITNQICGDSLSTTAKEANIQKLIGEHKVVKIPVGARVDNISYSQYSGCSKISYNGQNYFVHNDPLDTIIKPLH